MITEESILEHEAYQFRRAMAYMNSRQIVREYAEVVNREKADASFLNSFLCLDLGYFLQGERLTARRKCDVIFLDTSAYEYIHSGSDFYVKRFLNALLQKDSMSYDECVHSACYLYPAIKNGDDSSFALIDTEIFDLNYVEALNQRTFGNYLLSVRIEEDKFAFFDIVDGLMQDTNGCLIEDRQFVEQCLLCEEKVREAEIRIKQNFTNSKNQIKKK